MLWISCLLPESDFVLDGFKRRLLGLRESLIWESVDGMPRPTHSRLCFYYDYFDLFRYRAIDGVFLAQARGAQLIVNEFSDSADLLRQSRLCQTWAKADAVIDPLQAERDRKAMAIRAAIDRSDPKAAWRYLYEQYGVRTTVGAEYETNAIITIPREEIDGQTS